MIRPSTSSPQIAARTPGGFSVPVATPSRPDPDHGDVRGLRAPEHFGDRRLGEQRVPRRPRAQQLRARAGIGTSRRAARPARGPTPRPARATPRWSARRRAAPPRRSVAGRPRTRRPWPGTRSAHQSPSTCPSRSVSSSHCAARSPAAASVPCPAGTRPPARAPARTARRSAFSSSFAARGLVMHPDLDDALRAGRRSASRDVRAAVPSARATSSCDRPSRKYMRAALISAARSRGAGIVRQVLVSHRVVAGTLPEGCTDVTRSARRTPCPTGALSRRQPLQHALSAKDRMGEAGVRDHPSTIRRAVPRAPPAAFSAPLATPITVGMRRRSSRSTASTRSCTMPRIGRPSAS